MKRVLKTVIAVVAVLVVLLVVAVVGLLVYVNDIARTGVQKGSTYALGVDTQVESVSVGLFSGEFGMSQFDAAQPDGFGDSSFFKMGDAEVALTPASLMKDTIEVPYLRLHDINLELVRNENGANHEAIMEHLQSLSKPSEDEPAPADQPSKKFIIRDLDIRNVTVTLKGYPVAENMGALNIKRIQLKDVGTGSENGLDVAHLTGVIMREIFAAVATNFGDVLPNVLAGSLEDGLKGLGEIGNVGTKVVGETAEAAGKALEGAAEGAGKAVEGAADEAGKAVEGAADEAGKAVDDAAKELGQGIGNLLGGNKKDDDKQE